MRRFLGLVGTVVMVMACGAKAPPATSSSASATSSPSSSAGAASDDAVKAFLAARPGEENAESAPIPGVKEPTADDSAIVAKCDAAREKALQKSAKKPAGKQMGDALKAMDKADKRCLDLKLAFQTSGQAKNRDERAQLEIRKLARALAKSPEPCTGGAANPTRDLCMPGLEEMLWDREGWSCLAKGFKKDDRSLFDIGPAYVYSFKVDPKLAVYEIVGKGCQMLLGTEGNAETEIVIRGRLAEDVADDAPIFRRPLSRK